MNDRLMVECYYKVSGDVMLFRFNVEEELLDLAYLERKVLGLYPQLVTASFTFLSKYIFIIDYLLHAIYYYLYLCRWQEWCHSDI